MATDFAIAIVGGTGNGNMTFGAGGIMNNIFLSLMVDKGSFFADTSFGSRLYLLNRAKNTEKTASLARSYCKEALQWLIDAGRATAVAVYSQRDMLTDKGRLKLAIEVTQANGQIISFTRFLEVV